MDRKGAKGSITVFLSLACILFLSLICATVESARIQGARAQTANITGMGSFSLLGEYENSLLEKYNIFGLDGSYGSGSFQISKVNDRLQSFISYNANPGKDILSLWCFDPWNLELTGSSISGYVLLTDDKGEAFYQQATAYMKANLGVIAIEKLMEYTKDVEEIERRQEEYETSLEASDDTIAELEQAEQEKLEELKAEGEESGEDNMAAVSAAQNQSNPLTEIAKLRKKSTLEIVTWDKDISTKKLATSGLPSKSVSKTGNYTIEKENSGTVSNVLFREYLLMYFDNYLSKDSGTGLDYQIEYILGGKTTDKENLKYVVNRLLLIREGMNYLYCVQDQTISSQAGTLAVTLTGWLGIPALTAATKHALLLAWAYGESLVDLRILLDGGKVPIFKDASSWSLPLENLGRITEVLQQGAPSNSSGLSYRDYLRVLLNMGTLANQKMRALDIIQTELRAESDSSNFKAENCIVAVKIKTEWNCGQVFLSLPQVTMGIGAKGITVSQESSIAY